MKKRLIISFSVFFTPHFEGFIVKMFIHHLAVSTNYYGTVCKYGDLIAWFFCKDRCASSNGGFTNYEVLQSVCIGLLKMTELSIFCIADTFVCQY